jgi:hypothetical protein
LWSKFQLTGEIVGIAGLGGRWTESILAIDGEEVSLPAGSLQSGRLA